VDDPFLRKPEMQQGDKIDCRECEQPAERDDLCRELPGNCQYRNIGEHPHNPFVVGRIASFRAQMAEDFLGDHVVASHAV